MADVPIDRTFFMHVMKTAGTSFGTRLVRHFGDDEVYPTPGPTRNSEYWNFLELLDRSDDEKSRIRLIQGHFPLFVRELVPVERTITILRDPIERLISHLRQLLRFDEANGWSRIEEVYEHPLTRHLTDYQVRQFSRAVDDDPLELDDSHLTRALERLDTVELVGFTDRYDAFTQDCFERYGWDCRDGERLQVAPGEIVVDPAFRRRLAADNAVDVEFYRAATDRRGDGDVLVFGRPSSPRG